MSRTKRKTKQKFYMYIGDWSQDGHEVSIRYMFESNYPLDEMIKAYRTSCAKVGYQFHAINPDGDYTGRHNKPEKLANGIAWDCYAWNENLGVFTRYQESFLRDEPAKAFMEHGLKIKEKYQIKPYTPLEVAKLILDFIGLSLKNFQWKRIKTETKRLPYYYTRKDKIPYLNENRELSVLFGYGVMKISKEETELLNMQALLRDLHRKNKIKELKTSFNKYMKLESKFPKYLCRPPNFYILNKMYGIPERAFHGLWWDFKMRQNQNL